MSYDPSNSKQNPDSMPDREFADLVDDMVASFDQATDDKQPPEHAKTGPTSDTRNKK